VYESDQLYNGQNLYSYNNQSISIAIDADGVSANAASVIQPDILAYNGVVHALGEVMPFDFPEPAGSCGTWTIQMSSSQAGGTGWGGATVNVLSNGILIASETKTTNAPESFTIPVDEGARVDVVYVPGGSPGYHGFAVVDASGNTVYESQGSANWSGEIPPMSVYGLNPCGAAPTCGLVEIQFVDNSADGWYGGGLGVYSESGLEANILFNPDFDGDGYTDYQSFQERRVRVTVDEGEVDFIVNQPLVFSESCGYVVRNPAGQVVVDQDVNGQAPASVSGVVICEDTANDMTELNAFFSEASVYPNPASDWLMVAGIESHVVWNARLESLTGQVVSEFNGTGSQQLALSGITPGLYLLRVNGEPAAKTFRVIID
jgi:hypothetical protein